MKPVNLIPEGQRRRDPAGKSGSSAIVLAALGVLFVMSALYVFTANQVTSRDDAATAARSEADQLDAKAAQLGGFGSFADVKATRIASVSQLAAGRFDWERLMRELARVLPDDTWLLGAEASLTGEDSSSSTGATTTVSGPQIHLTGCTPRQPDVATMMLRLRRMHRVEDVLLGESTREKGGAAATLDSCGRFYQFDITVAFTPIPVPEAPAGHHTVPASLGGGS